ncbi:MAG: transcriptional regulator, partial [Streptosporangiaceae bacterium]
HDGFTLEAAESVLGNAVDTVRGLVDQSLLSVKETPAGLRYRMLETVREFGRMQLVQADEASAAQAALRRWASVYVRAHGDRLASTSQFEAIDALSAEEINLADELRGAIADDDLPSLVQLLAVLGLFWTMRGEHVRLLVLAQAVADAVSGWQPPPELADTALAAVGITLSNSVMTGSQTTGRLLDLLRGLGPDTGGNVYLSGLIKVMLAFDPVDDEAFLPGLEQLADDPDRHVAAAASQWLSHTRENAGDPVGSLQAARRALALARDEDGPWARAMPQTVLAQLAMNMGDRAAAIEYAQAAILVMQRLGASDDEIELRTLLVHCAIADGRLADAEAELERIDRIGESATVFGVPAFQQLCHAELALASGDLSAGLRAYRDYVARMREQEFPGIARTGTEPWVVAADAIALTAHAYYAKGDDEAHGRTLFHDCRERVLTVFSSANTRLDYPITGQLLFALGAWSLLRRAAPADDAVRLLVLAERFAYARLSPTVQWERIEPPAEEAAPGRIAGLRAEYADRRLPDLVAEARQAVERLLSLQMPSVAPH